MQQGTDWMTTETRHSDTSDNQEHCFLFFPKAAAADRRERTIRWRTSLQTVRNLSRDRARGHSVQEEGHKCILQYQFVCRSISLPIRDVRNVSINTPFHDLHGIVVSHARFSACVYSPKLNFYSIAVEILDKATSSNTPWSWAKIHGSLRILLSYLPAEMQSVNQTD